MEPRTVVTAALHNSICGWDFRSRRDWYLEISMLLLIHSGVTLVAGHYLDTLAGQLNPSLSKVSAYAIFVCDQHALLLMAIHLSL